MFLLALTAIVGVIDTGTPRGENIEIVSKHTDSAAVNDFNHGLYTVRSIQEAGPVKIIYASPFKKPKDNNARGNEVEIDWEQVFWAVNSFKKRGVKYICTNFNTTDREGAEWFADLAQKNGMIVVASLGNNASEAALPASIPGVVAVLGHEQVHKVSNERVKRADYIVSGKVQHQIRGSSFAAARVCGQLAMKESGHE